MLLERQSLLPLQLYQCIGRCLGCSHFLQFLLSQLLDNISPGLPIDYRLGRFFLYLHLLIRFDFFLLGNLLNRSKINTLSLCSSAFLRFNTKIQAGIPVP